MLTNILVDVKQEVWEPCSVASERVFQDTAPAKTGLLASGRWRKWSMGMGANGLGQPSEFFDVTLPDPGLDDVLVAARGRARADPGSPR